MSHLRIEAFIEQIKYCINAARAPSKSKGTDEINPPKYRTIIFQHEIMNNKHINGQLK